MNAVEIEEAVSQLAEAPFDADEFPFAFLTAFGNKTTTIKKLKSTKGGSNKSDLGGVLQRNNIHIKVCGLGEVADTLGLLRESPATGKYKAKFILATDGHDLQAENLIDGETIACNYPDFHDHFGFFLPLAGITTVKQIRENAFDIKATGRLNRLYVELLKQNPDWDTAERRPEMNHFMARLIFCFFAEDTNIFYSEGLFTQTVQQMSASDSSNTHEVLAEIFRAMATPLKEREGLGIRNWANGFPYANGGLFGPSPGPHPLAPSPRTGEGGQEAVSPLSQLGRGAGGEGLQLGDSPHPPNPLLPEREKGGQEGGSAPLSQLGRGAGGEGLSTGNHPHPLTPATRALRSTLKLGEGGQDPAPLSQLGRGAGGEGLQAGDLPHPLTPSPNLGEGGQEGESAPLSQLGRGAGGEGQREAGGEGLEASGEGVPRFSRIARSYLLHVGNLDWTKINPDIFGSMIQAVADDEERGALGMHYTSVPNILKVLNPLFLDDLRAQLEAAGDNPRKLLNLRKRMARIRVFDPACGSGNFLVIAYKEMRAIEAEINRRRGEPDLKSEIPLTNFRGIEIRHFSCEVARLALIIAEYQCDVLYRGQRLALAEFLPLKDDNWITCGNALRLDWLSICPPTGTGVTVQRDDLDLFNTLEDVAEVDFENEGGETYICGNPPYRGSQWQTAEQKSDIQEIFEDLTRTWASLDYVSGWFMKAANYGLHTNSAAAFVSTNSICQGRQVENLWPLIFATGQEIKFAHTSFKWANLASHNAGVTVVIVGISANAGKVRQLFSIDEQGEVMLTETTNINAYLAAAPNVVVKKASSPLSGIKEMTFGNMPNDGGFLLLNALEAETAINQFDVDSSYVRPFLGSQEFIRGIERRCIWVLEPDSTEATENQWLHDRFESVKHQRSKSRRSTTQQLAEVPFRFGEVRQSGTETVMIVPSVSSENREYLPVGYCPSGTIISNLVFGLFDAPLWNMALIASRLHLVWIATVCGKLKTDYRYSNTLGWNTFPVPKLTEQNKADLTRCAEEILLAREHYFPATIADMYDPDRMDSEFPRVRAAHDRNDEVLERIYIGRRFKNDTERLEKLFELYTKMTA